MKIAISTTKDQGTKANVEARFGRCQRFAIYDTETESYSFLENNQNASAQQGAGIQSAQTILDQKIEVVLTGFCGPKAFRVLTSAGVRVFVGIQGTVEDAVSQFLAGTMEPANAPNAKAHW